MKGPDIKMLGTEVKLAMKHRLGPNYKASKVKGVLDIHKEFFVKRGKIETGLHIGALKGETFAKKMNGEINKYLQDVSKTLSKDDYVALTNLQPGERVIIVDPKIAAKVHK